MRSVLAVKSLMLAGAALLMVWASDAAGQATSQSQSPRLRLARLFGDGVVLQRHKPIAVWGWADPDADVSIAFRGHTTHARASSAGSWKTTLPPAEAGGPFEMTVRSRAASIVVHNVLVGDVWVASGQSNMEFEVSHGNNAAQEIATANDSLIRQFKVPNSWANSPEDEVAGGSWEPADPQHVGAFSAVGYFFARDLRKSVHVPIGILNTTWSGSNIETWMSRGAQRITDSAWADTMRAQECHA
jgi:sialate O-acetylesterase